MTLRTWSLLLLLAIFAILFAGRGANASEPLKAKVLSIETRGDELVYKISTEPGTSPLRFCPEISPAPVAALLQEAYQSGDSIELKMAAEGDCLISVRIAKGA